MRLLYFRVKNFRGIGKGNGTGLQINLTDQNITFLIGQNNVGKSSLLYAYDYFFNDKKAKIDDFFDKDINNSIEIEIVLELTADEIEENSSLFKGDIAFEKVYFRKIWKDKDTLSDVHIGQDENSLNSINRKNKKELDWYQKKLPEPIWIKGMSSTEELVSQLQRLVKSAILDHLEDKYEEQYKSII